MPYMLLIVDDPARRATRTEAEGQAVYGEMVDFSNALRSEVPDQRFDRHRHARRALPGRPVGDRRSPPARALLHLNRQACR